MSYEILRMPKSDDTVKEVLFEIGAFLDAMYSKEDEKINGPMRLAMDSFLMLWDTGGLFLLVKRDNAGQPILVAMCSQYKDLWSSNIRVEIQRVTMSNELDEQTEKDSLIKYLKGIASLLKFDQLYYHTYYADGGVYRDLVWNNKG